MPTSTRNSQTTTQSIFKEVIDPSEENSKTSTDKVLHGSESSNAGIVPTPVYYALGQGRPENTEKYKARKKVNK